jgi:hypothetical protein
MGMRPDIARSEDSGEDEDGDEDGSGRIEEVLEVGTRSSTSEQEK